MSAETPPNDLGDVATETATITNMDNLAEDAAALSDAATHAVAGYADILVTEAAYIELGLIGIALIVAYLIGWAANVMIQKRLKPILGHSWEWLMKPLALLPSFLSIIALTLVAPIVATYVETPHFTSVAIHVMIAWLVVRSIFILLKTRSIAWLISILITASVVLDIFGLLTPTITLLEGIGFSLGGSDINLLGILKGMVLCVILFWLAFASSRRVETQLRRSSISYNVRELLIKLFKILLFTLAILISLTTVGVDLTALAVFGGALGVGVGFGLQSITSNFISGIILLMEKSLKQGDLIEVGGVQGYVRELNIRSTMIETFGGQEVSVPNETLLSSNLTNYTMNNKRARIEIPIGVAYGSDYALVKELLLQAAHAHPRCMGDPEPACFMREFGDSSVNFLLQFWVEDVIQGCLGPQSDVMFDIARLLEENNISIPFPQRDVRLIQA